MKNIVINYKIFSDKINDKNILLLADLHDYPGKRKSSLIDDINEVDSDLIIIAGDTLHSSKYAKGSLSQKQLSDFLKHISETKPVVLGLGNHDLFGATEETLEGYKDLENARPGMVFPLSNEAKDFDGIRVIEFHPRHSAFSPSLQESGKALLKFYADFKEDGIIPDGDKFNVMICHNPKLYANARCVGEQLKFNINEEQSNDLFAFSNDMGNYDLVVSGHLHNGYIPITKTIENPSKYMDEGYWEMPVERNMNYQITKVRPWIMKKTDLCRGTIFVGEIESRIIELCDGSFYFKKTLESTPKRITEKEALEYIDCYKLKPLVITGGINKYFNLPIDKGEITNIKILKK